MDMQQKYLNYLTKNSEKEGFITKYHMNQESVIGTILHYELGDGIDMTFFDYVVKNNYEICNLGNEDTIEIFYCLDGNVIIEYGETSVLLKENMFGVYDYNTSPQRISLEKGRIKGISLMVKPLQAGDMLNKYLSAKACDIEQISNKIAENRQLFFAFNSQKLRAVFLCIVENRLDYDQNYLILKAMELILVCNLSMQKEDSGNRKDREQKEYQICQKAIKYMKNCIADSVTTKEIAQSTGVTEKQLNHYFVRYTNQTAYAYWKEMRLKKAKELLLHTTLTITEIAGNMGWQNPSKFSEAFKKRYGITPKNYREENKVF